jgi:hypothetical protein
LRDTLSLNAPDWLLWALTFIFLILDTHSLRAQDSMSDRIVQASRLSVASSHRSCKYGKWNRGRGRLPIDASHENAETERAPETTHKSDSCAFQKTIYSQRTGRMTMEGNVIDGAPKGGTDCSGFVSGILCRAGARLKPNNNDCGPVSTKQMIQWGTSGNDCFETFQMTARTQLKAGCIVVWREVGSNYGHVILVQDSGDDPFRVSDIEDCSKTQSQPKFWDFRHAESLHKIGPSQWDSQERFKGSKKDIHAMGLLATRACEARKSDKPLPASVSNDLWHVKVVCHSGSKRPECVSSARRTFKGENCISHCMNTPSNESVPALAPIRSSR